MADLGNIVNCFLYLDDSNDGDGVSNLKLQKLVYYAQGFYSAIFGKSLFENEIEAWTHGPVIPSLYHAYKHYGSNKITVPAGFDMQLLTQDEIDLVAEVYEVFGQYSAWKLRDMTHEESPWLNHESNASIIPKQEIFEFFKIRIN